jgi:hypothetical protein
MHVVELGYRMRVPVDAHHAAKAERGLVSPPVEIELPRTQVDFHRDAVLAAGAQHFLNIR